jgi:hypothetical protein
MSTQKYRCMYRGAPSQNKPSAAQMQGMFVASNEWKENSTPTSSILAAS